MLYLCVYQRRQWHPTPILLPGKPHDGGAWWAADHGVAESQTGLRDFLSLFTFMHWRRKWQPTPVSLPGESQGRGKLVGCRLWGRTKSDTTEATQQQQQLCFYFWILCSVCLILYSCTNSMLSWFLKHHATSFKWDIVSSWSLFYYYYCCYGYARFCVCPYRFYNWLVSN